MYREVLFELVEGRAVTPLFRALSADPDACARLQAVSLSSELVTILIDYAGRPPSVAHVRDVVQRYPAQRHVRQYETIIDEPGQIRFMVSWERPDDSANGVSLEHVLYDTVGPAGLLFGRVEKGVIAYKAAAPDGKGLSEFLEAAQVAFGERFRVRPVRTGAFRPDWEIEEVRRRVDPDEQALLAAALTSGYYDEPKRCGVRELGSALGVSKSVVARRLRELERRALESLMP